MIQIEEELRLVISERTQSADCTEDEQSKANEEIRN